MVFQTFECFQRLSSVDTKDYENIELFFIERKSSGSSLESQDYDCRDPSHWPRGTLYPQKLALTFGRYSLLADSDHGV
jgi:hypothetical protein